MSFLFSRWPFFSHSWKETGQQAWDHWLSGPLSSPCRRNLALCPFPLSHRFKTTIPSDFWEDALFLLLTKSHQPADSFYSVFHRPGWIYNILLADGPTFVFGIPCLSLGPLFKYTPPFHELLHQHLLIRSPQSGLLLSLHVLMCLPSEVAFNGLKSKTKQSFWYSGVSLQWD